MSKRKKKHRIKAPGTAPGTVMVDPDAPKPHIRVLGFGPDGCDERTVSSVDEIAPFLSRWPVTWVDVDGLGDADTLHKIGQLFKLHPLALEDAASVHQRPKVEEFEGQIFIVARMATLNGLLDTEQLSLFLGRNFVITFQEGVPGDPFDPVRHRIKQAGGRIRQLGPDYLAYALLDAVIDGYFPRLEQLGERLDVLEDQILARPDRQAISRLFDAKRELLNLRRAVWPLREGINSLLRDPSELLNDETRLHLRDCYDHVVRIIDLVETYRELGSDLIDLYMSSVSQRLNEVMKVLTIIATIFIPLTFISSIYGMNFNTAKSPWNMPELNWFWGYPFALGLMAVTAMGLVFYVWWKGWLRETATPPPNGNGEHL